ncbi:MAG: hypothetical protein M3S32_07215 [Acidobacteriota bacterium]|nr:hypothetical protein [Acidobacteriota bacterium]
MHDEVVGLRDLGRSVRLNKALGKVLSLVPEEGTVRGFETFSEDSKRFSLEKSAVDFFPAGMDANTARARHLSSP